MVVEGRTTDQMASGGTWMHCARNEKHWLGKVGVIMVRWISAEGEEYEEALWSRVGTPG